VAHRVELLEFAAEHMIEQAKARVLRRLIKDPNPIIRNRARVHLERSRIREVALPPGRQGDWTTEGWLKGTEPGRIQRHRQGRGVREKLGLPVLQTVKSLRELLGIKSPSQLGWFLVASDEGEGPYTRYTIPKRDGTQREICAPKPQLRWTQKQILRQILDRVP